LVNSLIEAVLIVFSVLVALAANRWRDQRASRQRLDLVEQHLGIELENNQAILGNIIPYHEAEVRRIGQFLAQPDLKRKINGLSLRDLMLQLMPRGFWNPAVSPGILSDSAWRSAVADNTVSLMNVRLLNQLAAYYSLQDSGVQRTLQIVGQEFLSPQMYDPKSTILMLKTSQGWFNEMASEEKELLFYADKTLTALPPPDRQKHVAQAEKAS
jgi:hypothetical protein